MNPYRVIINPDSQEMGDTSEEFLRWLNGPACLIIDGEDNSRCRAVVTLLHGNEPSGVKAIYRWIKRGHKPRVKTAFFIAAVTTALTEPVYSHRHLPGKRDLNRCFAISEVNPQDDEIRLAQATLQMLRQEKPEAIIDLHNTSGDGPAFAVATFMDQQHDQLAAIFSERLIITQLRLGALMEISEQLCPTITIECGGRDNPASTELAYSGIQQFLNKPDLFDNRTISPAITHYHNPVRVELKQGNTLAYASERQADFDLSLIQGIETFNFGLVAAGTVLGWSDLPVQQLFDCVNHRKQSIVQDLLGNRQGEIITLQPLQLFMVTENPLIAAEDCLFYAVSSSGHEPGALR